MDAWVQMIEEAMNECGDSWENAVELHVPGEKVAGCEARSHPVMTKEFDGGFGGTEGTPFTLYTATRVYFPTEYDGAEGVNCVLRFPPKVPTPTDHV